MRHFDPANSFLGDTARRYDDAPRGDEAETVALLAELARGTDAAPARGTALELAVGTGRIALPLSAAGVRVDGIELSPDMAAVLAHRPGGAAVDVVLGDMSSVATGRRYPLVYLVFNTIFNLLTQDEQVRCFDNAARHLNPDGVFLVEAAVPSAWIRQRDYVDAEAVELDHVVLDVCRYDPVSQILDESHVRLDGHGVRLQPISCRLAWPSELDLMARIAGLELRQRWGGWHREPFTGDSVRHVSLYRRRNGGGAAGGGPAGVAG